MFCDIFNLQKICIKNMIINENDYNKIMENNNNEKSITSYVIKNRKNDYTNFLIILGDKHYKKNFFNNSVYDYLKNYDLPGKLLIINENELNNNIIINENIILKKLYIKAHKENLYIDALKYEDFLLNSITNEFLHIISMLSPMSIKIKIYNQNKNDIDYDINSLLSFQGIDLENSIKNQNIENSNNNKEWLLTFSNKNKIIDLSYFLDKKKFYYLPVKNDWLELINNRIKYNVNSANYLYEYSKDNDINLEFLQKMKYIKIDWKYKKRKYENLKFEYEIKYYSL
jgi:hypothetical protein